MGDEVMATFPTADDALNAAAQMQKQITLHPALKVEEQAVAIRIGCNFGPVVRENRDIFGSAVHTANRMTSQAKAGQIMTTATMVDHLSSEWRASVRQIDIATLKGRSSEVALFEVLWQTRGHHQHGAGDRHDLARVVQQGQSAAAALSGPGDPGRGRPRQHHHGPCRGERSGRQGQFDFAACTRASSSIATSSC